MGKFTNGERPMVKNIIATLSLKRIPDNEIIKEIERQTNKIITRQSLYDIRQQIKKESYQWYSMLRESQYEYIHEFRARINEIMDLQKKHYELIESNKHNPSVQQTSLAELHRLTITLSNLYDVAPSIINNGPTIPTTPEVKTVPTEITV